MRKLLLPALILSLLLNLLLLGGYAYQRLVLQPRAETAWATATLNLDAGQQRKLAELQSWTRDSIKSALLPLQADIELTRAALRAGKAGDPQTAAALQRIGAARVELQVAGLDRMIEFRAALEPAQRKTFDALADQPGFRLRLLGLMPERKS
jgi:hypothetical protein